jgi:type VII secretion protein EccE
VRPAQIVATQIAAAQLALVALLLAALGRDPLGWLVAAPVAGALVALAFLRWRGRWLRAWLATGLRYRAATGPAAADPAALLAFVEPTAGLGAEPTAGFGAAPGVIEDSDGIVAVIELGDAAALLSGPEPALPSPAELLAAGSAAPEERGAVAGTGSVTGTVQLIISTVPAGGTGPAAASYRQLTDGWIPARQRALLAIRMHRTDGAWSGDDLRRLLAGTVRRIGRRLRQDRIEHRPLPAPEIRAALAELAPHHPAAPAREGWSTLRLGGLCQTSLRVPRLDRLPAELIEQLIARLLAVAAASTTIGLSASGAGTDLVVRVAAGTPAGLAHAVGAVHRLLAAAGSAPVRLDGEQRGGLAATLPLARPPAGGTGPCAPRVALGPAGLMLGRNRHRQPVTVRLLRPRPTRAVLLGGLRAAQVLILRGLAVGAQVSVETARPLAWEPFLRAVSLPTGAVTVRPPGSPPPPVPVGPPAPQLLVLDAGPAPVAAVPSAPWRATVVLREHVSAGDAAELDGADLVILQQLSPDEATLVGTVLGLAASRDWLSRIRPDMVGAVSRLGAGRSAVRWAALSLTEIEHRLIGVPERVAG